MRAEADLSCWGRAGAPFAATSERQTSAIEEASIAYTLAAPAFAAKNDRIPEPAPTSTTTLPSKSARFCWIASMYVVVRTLSSSIVCWLDMVL